MEERIIDKDDERRIKVKRNGVGGIDDAVEESSGQAASEEFEEEVTFEIPKFDQTNEDLIGLSEQQMKEAREERDKLFAEGERLLKKSAYAQAEPFFAQSLLYDPDYSRAKEALWICRTENFENLEAFYDLKRAEAISEADGKTKEFIRKHVGERLAADRREYEEAAAPLKKSVTAAQSERRAAFERNRKYYMVRVSAFITVFLAFLIAATVSAYYIVRTTSPIPIVLTIVFIALAAFALLFGILFSRKLFVAQRYCSTNEKLSSTEDGERLEYLLNRLECLALILDDEE